MISGFIFNQPLQVCDDIDECYQELDDCLDGMETCTNTLGSYTCEPIAESVNNTINNCPPGRYMGISTIFPSILNSDLRLKQKLQDSDFFSSPASTLMNVLRICTIAPTIRYGFYE